MGFNEIEKEFPDGCIVTFKKIGMSEFYGMLNEINLNKEDDQSQDKVIETNLAMQMLILSKAQGIRNGDKIGTSMDARLYVDCLTPDEMVILFKELAPSIEKNLPSQ